MVIFSVHPTEDVLRTFRASCHLPQVMGRDKGAWDPALCKWLFAFGDHGWPERRWAARAAGRSCLQGGDPQ